MADRAMNVYLNDHLAGAMLGSDLAEQIQNQSEGTALGELMKWLAPQIEEDRQTLIALMERLHISRNPVKQATAWMAEKASRVKLGGRTSGEPEVGLFMSVEPSASGYRESWPCGRVSRRRRAQSARRGSRASTMSVTSGAFSMIAQPSCCSITVSTSGSS